MGCSSHFHPVHHAIPVPYVVVHPNSQGLDRAEETEEGNMSFAAWEVIWFAIGGLYGILGIAWGIIVWRGRPWSLDLFQSSEPQHAGTGANSSSIERN